ncbi:DUF7577 domain-containing protein [Haloglomus halophilum]|uniref:DUF7577 domain-containing protein n=1 Tax=Haloglomus halophilum TaxID=2962672 RepID=UPI0020C9BB59|nr:zinc-ribbon domain-containing protein [Haloglomus halophilum]
MGVSPWLVAALVLIPAVQVPLVLYLSKYVAADESELPPVASGDAGTPKQWRRPDPATAGATDGARCPTCGTVNEEGYRFCRACASLL